MTNKWTHAIGVVAGILIFAQSQPDFTALLAHFPAYVTQIVHIIAAAGVWAGIAYVPSTRSAQ